jgi:polyphosphate glucokinase
MKILGIDVGGTGIKGAIVNTETGELISKRRRIATPQPATPEAVAETIQKLIEHFKWEGPVGCGFPTPLKNGKCLTGGNLHKDWKNLKVDDFFKNKTGNTFSVVNDADAAGLAEITFGAGKGVKGTVIMITLGTGIGSTLFLDGKLVPNTEFGHVLHKNGSIFEKYAADSVRIEENLSRKQWGKRLHKYFKHINLLLSPDLIIIGGGSSKKFSKFEAQINIDTEITPAKAENDAGIIGAALSAV